MSKSYRVKVYFIVLTTDIPQNKQYILSLNKGEIELPSFYVDDSNASKINDSAIEYLQSLILLDKFQLMPQLISLNETTLPDTEPNTLCVVYGSVTKFSPSLNNCYWYEFNYFMPNNYNDAIIKTVQKLL